MATGRYGFYMKHLFFLFLIVSVISVFYCMWINIVAIKEKKPFAWRMMLGFMVLGISTLSAIPLFMRLSSDKVYIVEGFFFMTIFFASALIDRFAQVHSDLEHAHGALVVLDKMKDDFLATTSHELRTPLHGIIGLSEAMERDKKEPLSAKHRENMGLIKASAERLASLVNDILDFSKLQAGRVDLFLEEINLRDRITGLVSLAHGLVGEKKITLSHDIPEDLPSIIGDRHRIEQIMLNIIGNAIKFTESGEVRVRARAEDGGVVIEVSDTGPGMKNEDLDQIWSAYKQIEDPSTRHYEGAGLGLPISKRLVELHGLSLIHI